MGQSSSCEHSASGRRRRCAAWPAEFTVSVVTGTCAWAKAGMKFLGMDAQRFDSAQVCTRVYSEKRAKRLDLSNFRPEMEL